MVIMKLQKGKQILCPRSDFKQVQPLLLRPQVADQMLPCPFRSRRPT